MNVHVVDTRLRKVRMRDARFLYGLLAERDPKANISHSAMPSYRKHWLFVLKMKLGMRPWYDVKYSGWYIIQARIPTINQQWAKVGAIYITAANEIGIHITREWQCRAVGRRAIKLLCDQHPRGRYLANISPLNAGSIRFFQSLGFTKIMETYVKTISIPR